MMATFFRLVFRPACTNPVYGGGAATLRPRVGRTRTTGSRIARRNRFSGDGRGNARSSLWRPRNKRDADTRTRAHCDRRTRVHCGSGRHDWRLRCACAAAVRGGRTHRRAAARRDTRTRCNRDGARGARARSEDNPFSVAIVRFIIFFLQFFSATKTNARFVDPPAPP